MAFFLGAGGIGINGVGFYFSKRYPKYRNYVIIFFASSAFLIMVSGYILTMKQSRRYILRKFRSEISLPALPKEVAQNK